MKGERRGEGEKEKQEESEKSALPDRIIGSTKEKKDPLLREEDELAHVLLEACDVALEGLLGLVGPAVVHGDADRLRELGLDAGGAELVKGEATSVLDAHVVPARRARDNRAEELGGARGDLGGLGLAGQAPALLLHRLRKVDRNTVLPLLVEVRVGHDVLQVRVQVT